jgi:hypothetical protein
MSFMRIDSVMDLTTPALNYRERASFSQLVEQS